MTNPLTPSRVLALALIVFAAALPAAADDMVDNPEYQMWSKFKAGSFTKATMKAATPHGQQDMTIAANLDAIDAEKAVMSGKMTASFQGQSMDMPIPPRTIPAKVKKADVKPEPGKDAEGNYKADVKQGDEEIEVAGNKVKCHWVEAIVEADGKKIRSKSWMTPEIPGGLAKTENFNAADNTLIMSMVVTEYKAVK